MTWKTAFVLLGTASAALLFSAGVANAQSDAALAKRGQTLWQTRGCAGCHGIGVLRAGPDLAGVTVRRSKEWIRRWLHDTSGMIASDSIGMELVKAYKGQKMPNQKLSEQDADAIIAFINAEEAKKK